MIPTSDGSRAKAFFQKLPAAEAAAIREAVVAAIAKTAELSAEIGILASQKGLDIITQTQNNAAVVESTALDVAADVLASHWHARRAPGASVDGEAAALGAAGVAAGMSVGSVRHDLYRAGSILGDAEAIASGSPEKIVRRAGQHVFWRAFGKIGRGIFRGIGGKR